MKNILVTGAAGNLGSAVVEKFLNSGYRLIATVQNSAQLNSIVEHENLESCIVNLADEKETAEFIGGLFKKYGHIDGALMLVGGFAMGAMDETSGEAIHQMISLNFDTAYFTARPLLSPMMKRGYGRLVLVGARPALLASAGKGMVAYALSKSLLFKLAELINAETKGTNVTASVVVPSTIDTPQNRQSMPNANTEDWIKPSQLADLLEYICSERSLPLREPVYKVYHNA
jgi:NAD(P)-dependent dehydrogenase (short-subunit alcohol dehydrogenase family)